MTLVVLVPQVCLAGFGVFRLLRLAIARDPVLDSLQKAALRYSEGSLR